MTEKEPVELDPDFTAEEHKEFEQLEAEQPYREEPEEKIRVPIRPETVTDTNHDVLYLALFCIAAAIFLMIIVFGLL